MTHPREGGMIPLQDLSACCPEAQADGVPCTELDRSCAECQRAAAMRYAATREEDGSDASDPWAV